MALGNLTFEQVPHLPESLRPVPRAPWHLSHGCHIEICWLQGVGQGCRSQREKGLKNSPVVPTTLFKPIPRAAVSALGHP